MNEFKLLKQITLALLIVLFISPVSVSALETNFLNINVHEKGDTLIVKEKWNISLNEDNTFKRSLPLDQNCITNISITQLFPSKEALSFDKKYKSVDNKTIFTVGNKTKKNNAIVLEIQYSLELDNPTKENFLGSLPNSLFADKYYKLDKINLNADVEGFNSANTQDTKENVAPSKEFKQESSKSQTSEVLFKLLKIAFNIALIVFICFTVYVIAIFIYYRTKSKQKNNFKKRRKKSTTHFKTKSR